jgi:hypothetical protein
MEDKWFFIAIAIIFSSLFIAMGLGGVDSRSASERITIEAIKNGYEQVYDNESKSVLWKKREQ